MDYNKAVKVYTFTIPANGAFPLLVQSDYFRLQSATGAVDVTGDTFGTLPDLLTGQGLENTPYKRLVFTDKTGAPNTVAVLCSGDLFIDNRTYGVNTLDAATIAQLLLPTPRPEAHTGFFTNNAAVTSNVPWTVFTPAQNANGAILLSAFASTTDGSIHSQVFISKASEPAHDRDGAVYMQASGVGYDVAAIVTKGELQTPQYVPAGEGLYFISTLGILAGTGNKRGCRYKLL